MIKGGSEILSQTIYMHHLFRFEIWYVTNSGSKSKCVKFGGPHLQWKIEKHCIHVQDLQKTDLSRGEKFERRWTSHSPNLFYDHRYTEEILLISMNKWAFFHQSVGVQALYLLAHFFVQWYLQHRLIVQGSLFTPSLKEKKYSGRQFTCIICLNFGMLPTPF